MKKLSLLLLALALCAGFANAAPIDVNLAQSYGLKFVQNTLGQKSAALSLVYTQTSEAGVDALYIFNYDHGYVVVSADDLAHPVLGYSEDQPFDQNNIPEGLQYYLGYYARQIQFAIDNNLPVDREIADQWYLLGKYGVISKTRNEKAVQPLLTTTWDQDWPYNYYAPTCSSYWTNNHCYAGCVATSMSQVMKYWNWPETGVGEHSYTTSSYPGNGTALSANFGETTYNWAIMPNSLSQANDAAMAVALLMYHCGISVDMDYSPNGSGAHTEDVASALTSYFRYGACANLKSRDSYTKTKWEDLLIAQLDRGIPFVYAGSDSDGGHAFNCDGYNNNRLFHFNWGWSGSYNNTYYQIDALNTGNGSFNSYQRAVFDILPDYIYNAMVPQIETMNVEVADAITKHAVISWTVPTESVSGDALTSIQQIVLKRNGVAIETLDNPQPGETYTFEDNVADYGAYDYTIVGKNNGFEGDAFSQKVIFGPNCTWKFICQTTGFQGWNEGKLQVIGANGVVFNEITMVSSTPLSEKVQFPEGDFSLAWVAPEAVVSSLTITLKNSANQTVYSFTGSSTQLSGTLYSGTNDCTDCTPPTAFTGTVAEGGALLSWQCDYTPSKFKIYRSNDGETYEEVANVNGDVHEYLDQVGGATYYYKVTAYNSSCESTPAVTPNNDVDYVVVTVPMAVGENRLEACIYPNPTTDGITIEAAALTTVTVYNLMGQKVYEEPAQGDKCVIDLKTFGSGMYLVKMDCANGSITRKVTVIE